MNLGGKPVIFRDQVEAHGVNAFNFFVPLALGNVVAEYGKSIVQAAFSFVEALEILISFFGAHVILLCEWIKRHNVM